MREREMDVAPPLYQMLFPASTSFAEADYLAFLAQRVPKAIAEQLNLDGQPDLGLSETVDIEDLMRPLSSHVFPSCKLRKIADILSYTVIVYSIKLEKKPNSHNPYKLIYAISLYLYCFVRGQGPVAGAYLVALSILASVSMRLDLQTRLQVCRFLGSLIPTIHTEAPKFDYLSNEPAPLSSALIALSLIVGSIASDLSLMAENAMKSESFGLAWAAAETHTGTSTYDGIGILRRFASEMYGTSGKVRQIADRFLRVTEEGEENKDLSQR